MYNKYTQKNIKNIMGSHFCLFCDLLFNIFICMGSHLVQVRGLKHSLEGFGKEGCWSHLVRAYIKMSFERLYAASVRPIINVV